MNRTTTRRPQINASHRKRRRKPVVTTTAKRVTGATIPSGAAEKTLSARTTSDPMTTAADTTGPRSRAPIRTPKLREARTSSDTLEVLLLRIRHGTDLRIQILENER